MKAIDVYTTLVALEESQKANPRAWEAVRQLFEDDAQRPGAEFMLHSLFELRREEVKRQERSQAASFNGLKGFIPAEVAEGARLIVAPEREHNALVAMGYTKLKPYTGSGYELEKMSYFYSAVGGSAPYIEGALQIVHLTAMGVDPRSGLNKMGVFGPPIMGREAYDITEHIKRNGIQTIGGEPLVPVYDGQGEVVGYERSLDADIATKLERNTHMGEMMGAWFGRHQPAQRLDECGLGRALSLCRASSHPSKKI